MANKDVGVNPLPAVKFDNVIPPYEEIFIYIDRGIFSISVLVGMAKGGAHCIADLERDLGVRNQRSDGYAPKE